MNVAVPSGRGGPPRPARRARQGEGLVYLEKDEKGKYKVPEKPAPMLGVHKAMDGDKK